MALTPKQVVRHFWQAMQANDWVKVSQWLSEDVICDWVLSNERIVGRKNYIAVNSHYPVDGRWDFAVKSVLAEGDRVVVEVEVSDAAITETVVAFHTVKEGLITRQVEYWGQHYAGQSWRKPWIQAITER